MWLATSCPLRNHASDELRPVLSIGSDDERKWPDTVFGQHIEGSSGVKTGLGPSSKVR